MTLKKEALRLHCEKQGKLQVASKVAVHNKEDLALAYTPGVAEPCKEIHKDVSAAYKYTMKGNMVAVVTNGTAVLGLGDIGATASLPVMEGKALLFKSFAGVDAFPICINSKDIDKIVDTVVQIEPSFGGINLEDIAAPDCFEIEKRLRSQLSIPVFHDDQDGTAITVLAALINGLKIIGKRLGDIKVVVNGAGAAGIAITKILLEAGVENIFICDRNGIIFEGRGQGMNWAKEEIGKQINKGKVEGDLAHALVNADVFIGVSSANVLSKGMVETMNKDAIVFALANPIPEIDPMEAKEAGARIIGTGRGDYPNQINNVLIFPGIFRGALDVRASEINKEMKLAAAYALAGIILDKELREDYIIPDPFDERVATIVASAVGKAAIETGIALNT